MQIEWKSEKDLVPYPFAIEMMEARVAAIRDGSASEMVWLLQHPPLYTAGTSARNDDLIGYPDIPVFESGRGGQFTYHGPGQRIAYVMLDLTKRGNDVRRFVFMLEQWVINTLAALGVKGERRTGRVGVWVQRNISREDKIAAIGIRVRRGITYHGIALNINPNLDHYRGIVPCGITSNAAFHFGITSLADLGNAIDIETIDKILSQEFAMLF